MVNIMTRVKGEQIAEIQVLLSGDTVEEFKVRNATAHAISEVFGMMMQRFSTNKVFGFNINASNYYEMNKKRIHTKMRQARYRETHTEVRHWAQG